MSNLQAPGHAAIRYRKDIDGLRALAILPVVLYHYQLLYMPGGFVGVDIFFVISGYLITSLLQDDIRKNRFSLTWFYERRARRILPALFFVLVLTSCAAFFILLPADFKDYGRSIAAATAFSSNIYFWATTDYFGRAAEYKPLLHTWSLAVEEQFYILFPPLLYATSRWGRNHIVKILAALALASLAGSLLLAYTHPKPGYYLPMGRAWELLIGSLLAVGTLPKCGSRWAVESLSMAGLMLVLGSTLLIDRTMPFPGWLAAFPCLGAAVLIYTGLSSGGVGNRILSSEPLVFVGLISYSLYLWHWPLLVLAQNISSSGLNVPERLFVLMLAVGLSIFSWRFVERPFRGKSSWFSRRRIFQLVAIASTVTISVGVGLGCSDGLPGRFQPEVLRYENQATQGQSAFAECFNPTPRDVRDNKLCSIGAKSAAIPSFVVWGDSHADRMAVPISQVAEADGVKGVLASVGSCPPLIGVNWPLPSCREFNDEVVHLVDRRNVKYVIISAMWANYSEGTRYRTDGAFMALSPLTDDQSKERSAAENHRVFSQGLLRTARHFADEGKWVVLIGPVPEVELSVPEALTRAEQFGTTKAIGASRVAFEHRQNYVLQSLAEAAKIPGVRVIYPSSSLCGAASCAVESADKVLYIDDNHLSRAGLELIRPQFEGIFELAGKLPTAQAIASGGR